MLYQERAKNPTLENWSKSLIEAHQELRKRPMMDLFLLALLFLLQGLHGSCSHKDDFRFCGTRNQTNQSQLVYEKQAKNIIIENSAAMLTIRVPFSAITTNCSLPKPLGPYRFCIYWHQRNSTFTVTYGGTTNCKLNTMANSSFCFSNINIQNTSNAPLLFNVSYTQNEGLWNTSLRSAAVYSFHAENCKVRSIQVHDIEQELKELEGYMNNPIKGKHGRRSAPYEKLLHLESNLRKVEFEGENKTFGTSSVRATIWKIGSSRASQDLPFMSKLEAGKEVHGFAVNLPSVLFRKAKGRRGNAETRVLLVDMDSQALFQDQNDSRVLGKKVIGISVGNTSISDLPRNMVLEFFHDQLPRNVTPRCVFWDVSFGSGHGSWKSDGCETETGNGQTVCHCNHLTFFAVLMMSSSEIDYDHKQYLTIISCAGCIISAVASLFTIIFFFCSRRKHRDGTINNIYIHMNLLGAIFLLDVSFLLTEHLASSSNEAACKAGAIFLHLSLLWCLSWMGIEGYNLYRLVVEVFNPYFKHFLRKLCLVGWGLPILIVSVIFLVKQTSYGPVHIEVLESPGSSTNATICWITDSLIHNLVNLGCFSLVFVFNSAMLGATIWEILRQRMGGHKCKYALMLLGLSLVLGLPWALAFFSFSSGSLQLATLYLFTIINSLQGFLIFLWFWTMVLPVARKPYPTPSSSDSVRLQTSTSPMGTD
uniref:Adhesion G-protein coupled receptor G1 n=1 Tax=Pelusios castaneus TaxID=367368 RepID=A0A8C8RM18_9SAUR